MSVLARQRGRARAGDGTVEPALERVLAEPPDAPHTASETVPEPAFVTGARAVAPATIGSHASSRNTGAAVASRSLRASGEACVQGCSAFVTGR